MAEYSKVPLDFDGDQDDAFWAHYVDIEDDYYIGTWPDDDNDGLADFYQEYMASHDPHAEIPKSGAHIGD